MVNIALAPGTANHLTTHMLSMMHFSLVPALVPHTDSAHVLDLVLFHHQVEYHSQDMHIPHLLHLLLVRHLFWGSRDPIVLILVILEGFQFQHLTLLMACLVHPMVWAWGLVPRTALRLIKGHT